MISWHPYHLFTSLSYPLLVAYSALSPFAPIMCLMIPETRPYLCMYHSFVKWTLVCYLSCKKVCPFYLDISVYLAIALITLGSHNRHIFHFTQRFPLSPLFLLAQKQLDREHYYVSRTLTSFRNVLHFSTAS